MSFVILLEQHCVHSRPNPIQRSGIAGRTLQLQELFRTSAGFQLLRGSGGACTTAGLAIIPASLVLAQILRNPQH
jgi:hypothetical protein